MNAMFPDYEYGNNDGLVVKSLKAGLPRLGEEYDGEGWFDVRFNWGVGKTSNQDIPDVFTIAEGKGADLQYTISFEALVKEPGQGWVVAREGYFTVKAASMISLSKGKVDVGVESEIVDLKVLRKGE